LLEEIEDPETVEAAERAEPEVDGIALHIAQ
jgi:hypothetical protein